MAPRKASVESAKPRSSTTGPTRNAAPGEQHTRATTSSSACARREHPNGAAGTAPNKPSFAVAGRGKTLSRQLTWRTLTCDLQYSGSVVNLDELMSEGSSEEHSVSDKDAEGTTPSKPEPLLEVNEDIFRVAVEEKRKRDLAASVNAAKFRKSVANIIDSNKEARAAELKLLEAVAAKRKSTIGGVSPRARSSARTAESSGESKGDNNSPVRPNANSVAFVHDKPLDDLKRSIAERNGISRRLMNEKPKDRFYSNDLDSFYYNTNDNRYAIYPYNQHRKVPSTYKQRHARGAFPLGTSAFPFCSDDKKAGSAITAATKIFAIKTRVPMGLVGQRQESALRAFAHCGLYCVDTQGGRNFMSQSSSKKAQELRKEELDTHSVEEEEDTVINDGSSMLQRIAPKRCDDLDELIRADAMKVRFLSASCT